MTMQHPTHPDDERLAALAARDADEEADAGLRAHVAACERCEPMVVELRQLRSVLAELPDLAPSRRLQLVPPVPTPIPARGGMLRRLAAPFMTVGAALLVVGAVGASGIVGAGSGGAFSGAAGASARDAQVEVAGEGSNVATPSSAFAGNVDPTATRRAVATDSSHVTSGAASPEATAAPVVPAPGTTLLDGNVNDAPSPWPVVLFAGMALAVAGIAFRLVARAGP